MATNTLVKERPAAESIDELTGHGTSIMTSWSCMPRLSKSYYVTKSQIVAAMPMETDFQNFSEAFEDFDLNFRRASVLVESHPRIWSTEFSQQELSVYDLEAFGVNIGVTERILMQPEDFGGCLKKCATFWSCEVTSNCLITTSIESAECRVCQSSANVFTLASTVSWNLEESRMYMDKIIACQSTWYIDQSWPVITSRDQSIRCSRGPWAGQHGPCRRGGRWFVSSRVVGLSWTTAYSHDRERSEKTSKIDWVDWVSWCSFLMFLLFLATFQIRCQSVQLKILANYTSFGFLAW